MNCSECKIDHRGEGDEVILCKLHSAAGEMLEALKLAAMNFKRSEASGNFLDNDDHEAWTAMSKAIASAEGK